MPEKNEVQQALDELGQQLPSVTPHKGKPGAQAALGSFNGKKFLQNLLILTRAAEPFIPGPTGLIVTAIEKAISQVAANAASPQ